MAAIISQWKYELCEKDRYMWVWTHEREGQGKKQTHQLAHARRYCHRCHFWRILPVQHGVKKHTIIWWHQINLTCVYFNMWQDLKNTFMQQCMAIRGPGRDENEGESYTIKHVKYVCAWTHERGKEGKRCTSCCFTKKKLAPPFPKFSTCAVWWRTLFQIFSLIRTLAHSLSLSLLLQIWSPHY